MIATLLLGGLLVPTEGWLASAGAYLAGRETPVSKREWLRSGEAVDESPQRWRSP